MKKIILIFVLLWGVQAHSNPFEVAQNVFQEFRQVQELIKQVEEIIRQAEQQAEIIQNLSGKNIYQMTSAELELLRWLPSGDELLEPLANSEYGRQYQEIKDALDMLDPYEVLNIDNSNSNERLAPQAISRQKLQQATVANSAYAKTFMDQFGERVGVVSNYLEQLNQAETLKSSIDVGGRITAQAVINQIEINRSMAMLLQQKAAEVQVKLANERYNHFFVNGEEQ